jgi:hypothetical protein
MMRFRVRDFSFMVDDDSIAHVGQNGGGGFLECGRTRALASPPPLISASYILAMQRVTVVSVYTVP